MARQLPPLNALRVFEAAARHLSFTKAAEELHVTQAAVSHQVKQLEDLLGVALFRRFNRRLALTEAAQAYWPALREAFDSIDTATRQLGRRKGPKQLRISTIQSFAVKWLVPRMPRFQERHRDIELMLSTSPVPVDFRRDEVDVAIRLGLGQYPGLHVEHLMDDEAFPVCAPRLRQQWPKGLRQPADLAHHTLLHDTVVHSGEEATTWSSWLRRAALPELAGLDASRGPGYSDSAMTLQAAIAGQGVALGRPALVVDDLAAGLLVRPFDERVTVKSRFSYYLVCTPALAAGREVAAFRDWLKDEIVLSGL